MEWTNWLTLGIAVLGFALGLFNAVWLIRKDTVRMKVRFVSIYVPRDDLWTGAVEVINTGYLPVTITEVAFHFARRSKTRSAVIADLLERTKLPHRLEPRTAISIATTPEILGRIEAGHHTWCSAATACQARVFAKIKWKRG
ncbi:hypothetical protein A7X92_03745 [Stenotrophomonas maltophilia]|nr:hypothetical protein A7X92_03745 [Stenotrophomonas maltophilia]